MTTAAPANHNVPHQATTIQTTRLLWRLSFLATGAIVLTIAALAGPVATGMVHMSAAPFPVNGFVWYQLSLWTGRSVGYIDFAGVTNRTTGSGSLDEGDDSCSMMPVVRAARAFGFLSIIALLAVLGVCAMCLVRKIFSPLFKRAIFAAGLAACIFELVFFPLEAAIPSRIVDNGCFSGVGVTSESLTNVGAVSMFPLIAWFVTIAMLLEIVFGEEDAVSSAPYVALPPQPPKPAAPSNQRPLLPTGDL